MEDPKAPPLTPDGLRRFATQIGLDTDAVLKSNAPAELKQRVANRAYILQPTLLAVANAPEPVATAWVNLLSSEISALYSDVVASGPIGGPGAPPIGACRHAGGCIQTTKVACDVVPGTWSPGPC